MRCDNDADCLGGDPALSPPSTLNSKLLFTSHSIERYRQELVSLSSSGHSCHCLWEEGGNLLLRLGEKQLSL